MNQSENINELAGALSKAQGEMQAAIKDSINPFFKSKYADLGSVWDSARPVLSKNGLCVMQTTEMQAEKIIMVTILAHTSGQWIKSYLPLNPAKNDSQGVGAAITYLRRYSLSAIVGVVCDDDDDGETAVGRGKTLPQNKQSTPPIKQEAKPSIPKSDPKMDHLQPDPDLTKEPEPLITPKQLEELLIQYDKTTDQFKENCEKYIRNEWKINGLGYLLQKHYDKIMKWTANNLKAQEQKVI